MTREGKRSGCEDLVCVVINQEVVLKKKKFKYMYNVTGMKNDMQL